MGKKRNLLLMAVLAIVVILPLKVSAGSSSLVSSIEIEGIGGLDMSKSSWNLNFSTPYDYVNITATPKNSSVTIEGDGKVNVQEGANAITITATSEGKNETFNINLNVTKKSSSKAKSGSIKDGDVNYDKDAVDIKNPETGAFLNVSLIAISIVGATMLIKVVSKKQKLFRV